MVSEAIPDIGILLRTPQAGSGWSFLPGANKRCGVFTLTGVAFIILVLLFGICCHQVIKYHFVWLLVSTARRTHSLFSCCIPHPTLDPPPASVVRAASNSSSIVWRAITHLQHGQPIESSRLFDRHQQQQQTTITHLHITLRPSTWIHSSAG